jgi:hypothetical protein
MLHRNQDVFPAIFVRELGLHAYIHTLHTWQSAQSSSTRQTLFCFQDRLFFHQTDSFCLQDRFFCFYETQLSLPGCGTSRFAQSSSTPRRTMPREPAPVICFSHFSCSRSTTPRCTCTCTEIHVRMHADIYMYALTHITKT